MKKTTMLAVLLCITLTSQGQSIEIDSLSKAEITKLAFMTGNWAGSGWIMGRDQSRSEFKQTEKIQFKLDSTALLIEGKGMSNGTTIHNAMAIVTFNKEKKQYDFQSFLNTGRKGLFKGELIDNKFYWYPNENTRYVIWINENGQWYEKGEFNNGGTWYQFFEMTLNLLN